MNSNYSNIENISNEFDSDRRDLRVELRTHQPIEVSAAPMIWGRLVNELRYRLQVSWLRFQDDDPTRTSHCWVDLIRLTDQLCENRSVNESIKEEITQIRHEWEIAFQNELHLEVVEQARQSLHDSRCRGNGQIQNEIRFIADHCEFVTEWFHRVVRIVNLGCSDDVRYAVQLGMIIDELIHPVFSPKLFCFLSSNRSSFQGWGHIPRHNEMPIPLVPYQFNCLLNDEEWRRRLEALISDYSVSAGLNSQIYRIRWVAISGTSQIIDFVERIFHHGDDESRTLNLSESHIELTDAGQEFCQTHSLELRESAFRRPGSFEADLDPLSLKLLVHFLNNANQGFSLSWLTQNWQRFSSRRKTPGQDSVVSAVNRLSRQIRGAGIVISRDSTEYRLASLNHH